MPKPNCLGNDFCTKLIVMDEKQYIKPECKIIFLQVESVITASGDPQFNPWEDQNW